MRILVTGASGFIGRALVAKLVGRGVFVRAAHRVASLGAGATEQVVVGEISNQTEWQSALNGVSSMVHLAAYVHSMNEKPGKALEVNRWVNTLATLHLARQAADSGVQRFVFVSTLKVLGESTGKGLAFTEDETMAPQDPYAISKAEAERGLRQISYETGMEVVIVRPPLVYGPGVKGNFASLVLWVRRGLPLPFGSVHNRRSLVALDNLTDFIALCADRERSPGAANETFLISDGEDVSTSTLLRKVAQAYGVSSRLVPIPASWIQRAARLLGNAAVAERLLGSLVVDSSKARDLLGWCPVVTMDEQLRKMAEYDALH